MEDSKLYTFQINNWKKNIKGIVLKESHDWVLIRSLFADYIVDGFKIINKQYILKRARDNDEIFIEDVLKASNKWDFPLIENIPLTTATLFSWLHDEGLIFQMSLRDDTISYLGKVDRLTPKSFHLRPMSLEGVWGGYTLLFRFDYIRIMELDTDYINSLLSYNKSCRWTSKGSIE